jgi:hypothetical protein
MVVKLTLTVQMVFFSFLKKCVFGQISAFFIFDIGTNGFCPLKKLTQANKYRLYLFLNLWQQKQL